MKKVIISILAIFTVLAMFCACKPTSDPVVTPAPTDNSGQGQQVTDKPVSESEPTPTGFDLPEDTLGTGAPSDVATPTATPESTKAPSGNTNDKVINNKATEAPATVTATPAPTPAPTPTQKTDFGGEVEPDGSITLPMDKFN